MKKLEPQLSTDKMTLEWVKSMANDGRLDADELETIVEIAMRDGVMDAEEKSVLINIISNLNSTDFDLTLWNKVEQLIRTYKLDSAR